MSMTWGAVDPFTVMNLHGPFRCGAKTENLWLSAAHIPEVCSIEANRDSRVFHDSTEWMLDRNVFSNIVDRLFVPDVDVFVSRLNRQLDSYVSWRPDLMAIAVDAFSMDWTNAHVAVCFSSFQPGEQNTAEIIVGRPGRGHSLYSVLDNAELVSSGYEELDGHPHFTSQHARIC